MSNYKYQPFPKWIFFENGAKTIVKDEEELKKYKGWKSSPADFFKQEKPKVKKTKPKVTTKKPTASEVFGVE